VPNIIKIDPYHFQLYRFKVGPFFMRHSVEQRLTIVTYLQLSDQKWTHPSQIKSNQIKCFFNVRHNCR